MPLYCPAQGPSAVNRVEAFPGEQRAGLLGQREGNLPFLQTRLHIADHKLHNLHNIVLAQGVKNDGLVDPVQELRAEGAFERPIHRFP